MYSLVRWYIKTAFAFLIAGIMLGAWLMVRRELFDAWPHQHLVSAHVHVLQIGFGLFMIFGVALWLFPRPARDDSRYRPERVQLAYWLLTVATATRFAGEAARAWSTSQALRWLVVVAALAQVTGVACYVWAMWSRIRPAGSRSREAEGERF